VQAGPIDPVLERLLSSWPTLTEDARRIIAEVLSKASTVDPE
jgi:hypothetical protein